MRMRITTPGSPPLYPIIISKHLGYLFHGFPLHSRLLAKCLAPDTRYKPGINPTTTLHKMEKAGTDTDQVTNEARRTAQPEQSLSTDPESHIGPTTVEQHIPTEQESDINTEGFPEGGKEAWIVLAGTWCVLFCTFGLGNSIGVFQTYYVNYALRQYSSSAISWITSFMQWVLNFLPIVVRPPSFREPANVSKMCLTDICSGGLCLISLAPNGFFSPELSFTYSAS